MPVLAADYPLLDVFWTMLIFAIWVAWFMVLFRVIGDVFRRDDIGGGSKVLWMFFVIFAPFLGVFIYLISQGKEMNARSMHDLEAQQHAFDEHVKAVASNGGPADEIAKAKGLLDSGAISQVEFDTIKGRAIAGAA